MMKMMIIIILIAEVAGMAGAARSRKLGTGERFLTTKIFGSPEMETGGTKRESPASQVLLSESPGQ